MLSKMVHLLFEDAGFQFEYNTDSTLVTIRVNDFKLDEKNSKEGHEVYKENNKTEVYIDPNELKEVVKALSELIPEEVDEWN